MLCFLIFRPHIQTLSLSLNVGCANVINIHDIHNKITRMCKQIYLKFVFFTCNMRRHLLEPDCWTRDGDGNVKDELENLEWFVSIQIQFIFILNVRHSCE